MRYGIAGLMFGLMFCGAIVARGAQEVRDEDARLVEFFRAYLEEAFRDQPLTATRLGDHRFDDQIDALSPEARAAHVERDRRTLAELPTRIDFAKLSRTGQIDFEIFRQHLTREVWLAENFQPFEDDPRIYGDYLTESVYLLLTQSTLPKAVNVKHARARMAAIPRVIATARRTLKNPPQVKTETAIRQTQGAISFYGSDFLTLAGAPQGEGEIGAEFRAAVKALEGYLAFLKDEVLPRSQGEWRIGREKFVQKLDLELDAGLGADEVRREAETEANRVEQEMGVIARQLWGTTFPGEALPPDDPAGRHEMVRRVLDHVAQDHGAADSLVPDVQSNVAEIKAFITESRILRLPDPDRCRIIAMPEFMRGNALAYLNPAPPLDPLATSEYALSPPPADWDAARVTSLLREYNRRMLKILTIHEAYPGHYVQLEYSNREPSLIRKVLSSGTFAEGWAVYTEGVMLDQGFGRGDLGLRLQQLKFYLRAVVNAILDHDMHTGNMTDKQVLELLMGRAYQTEGEAVGKVIRSKQSSCQLSTYFVGRTAFTRLRRDIQREQGDRFDLGRYHEAVLAHGTIPVKYLPELVRASLAQARASSQGEKR